MSNDEASTHALIIPEPMSWFAPIDEDIFFDALKSISAITSLTIEPRNPIAGEPNHLILNLEKKYLDEESLRNLIGLMYRYSLNMTSLASQCHEKNAHWFCNPQKYWYESVFGTSK